jgi:hypothetical protein
MLDYYGQALVSSNSTVLTIKVDSMNCSEQYGYVSGGTVARSNLGTVAFGDLRASCIPLGALEVTVTAAISDAAEISATIAVETPTNKSNFVFRNCQPGEKLSSGQCVECVEGTFLLEYFPGQAACKKCPTGATTCWGNHIVVEPDYWRRYETSSVLLECPLIGACLGGEVTGEASCAEGFEGVLCAVCSVGYYLDTDANSCLLCEGSSLLTPTFIIILCCLYVLLVLLCIRLYRKIVKSTQDDDDVKEEEVEKKKPETIIEKIKDWYDRRFSAVQAKVKIVIATFQIILVCQSAFQINLPSSYTNFTNVFQFFNFSIPSILPLSCMFRHDFISTLMLVTLMPFFITGFLIIAFVLNFALQKAYVKTKFALHQLRVRLQYRCFSLWLLMTYLILPSITTTIFQIFLCENVDPASEDSSDNLYLIADYSIKCKGGHYYFGVTWAIVMIFVYPVGIPYIYYRLVLARKPEILKHAQINEAVEAQNESLRKSLSARLSSSSRPSFNDADFVLKNRTSNSFQPESGGDFADLGRPSAVAREKTQSLILVSFLYESYK